MSKKKHKYRKPKARNKKPRKTRKAARKRAAFKVLRRERKSIGMVWGPKVAEAVDFFKRHDMAPERVKMLLKTDREGKDTWKFGAVDGSVEIDRETRNLLLGLMDTPQAEPEPLVQIARA